MAQLNNNHFINSKIGKDYNEMREIMANNKKNDAITAMEDDFAQWYTDVCRKAELMDYSSVKGFIIYRPYSYAM